MFFHNIQPGVRIDYATGESRRDDLPDDDWQIIATEVDKGVAAETQTFDGLVDAIESTMERARNAAARHVCINQLLAY